MEITDEQRARLLELAASRGEKGFSGVVREAIDRYLVEAVARRELVDHALATLGTLEDEEADALEQSVEKMRRVWR